MFKDIFLATHFPLPSFLLPPLNFLDINFTSLSTVWSSIQSIAIFFRLENLTKTTLFLVERSWSHKANQTSHNISFECNKYGCPNLTEDCHRKMSLSAVTRFPPLASTSSAFTALFRQKQNFSLVL